MNQFTPSRSGISEATRNCPEIMRGSRVSRMVARVLIFAKLLSIVESNAPAMLSNRCKTAASGSAISNDRKLVLLNFSWALPVTMLCMSCCPFAPLKYKYMNAECSRAFNATALLPNVIGKPSHVGGLKTVPTSPTFEMITSFPSSDDFDKKSYADLLTYRKLPEYPELKSVVRRYKA